MISLAEILTAINNLTTAMNRVAQTTLNINGAQLRSGITAAGGAIVVKSSPGRVCTLTVIVGGSAAGAIYDAIATSATSTSNQIFTIPTSTGSVQVNLPTNTGIVVAPGTGQTVAVSFS